ncbi:MAG: DnaJ domain-containing protein [Dehalococcoidia bacterium]|nr:DnaJ domain-containing protein [Dehalococcoidia bacterium]
MKQSLNYYKVLTVRKDATTQQIRAAFRKKAMLYHPDHNPGKEQWANKKLTHIIEAYEVLGDADRRRTYDRHLMRLEAQALGRAGGKDSDSTLKFMVNVMRHRAVPSWARTAAFLYVFVDNYNKESKKAKKRSS